MSSQVRLATFCAAIGLLAFRAMAAPGLTLGGINDRGASGDGHAFELYGDFPSPETVRPIVSCDGRVMDAEVMAPPLPGQINVNVEPMPGGSQCSFSVQR